METTYVPEVCDLCLSKKYSILLELKTGRAMRSDRRIVNCNLQKYVCDNCGLVRSGQGFGNQSLKDYYSSEYRLSEQVDEYFFYTAQGLISRSSLFCDWMISPSGTPVWQQARRCLEVGAGSGLLVREVARRLPKAACEGVELNRDAIDLARRREIVVHQGEPADLASEQYDIVYSIAVLEHVPSPTEFLKDLRLLLKPGGHLFLCQPTQDVPSYDLFSLTICIISGPNICGNGRAKPAFRNKEFGLVTRGCLILACICGKPLNQTWNPFGGGRPFILSARQ